VYNNLDFFKETTNQIVIGCGSAPSSPGDEKRFAHAFQIYVKKKVYDSHRPNKSYYYRHTKSGKCSVSKYAGGKIHVIGTFESEEEARVFLDDV